VTQQADRLVRRVSLAASLGLAVMLTATVVYIGWPRVISALGIKPAAARPAAPAYVAGQQIDVPSAWYAGAPQTLIVFARASCAACERAQPFLKTLVGRMQGRGGAMMAHPAGAEQDDRNFARSLGVADDRVLITPAGLRVKATPTIVLVNAQGVIINAWEGAAKSDVQAEMLQTIDLARR